VLSVAFGAILVAGALCRFSPIDCHLCAWTPLECPPAEVPEPVAAAPAQLPRGFKEELVALGLGYPTGFSFLPDGGILLSQQEGLVTVLRNGRVNADPFLDIRAHVNAWTLRGLLSVEADPEFERNGFVYLLYTHDDGTPPKDGPKIVRLSRFTADGDVARPGSEKVLLGTLGGHSCDGLPVTSDCIPADGEHSGGDIEFGSDGTMYVTTGDGSLGSRLGDDPLRAQNLDSLAGKVLRITRDGDGIPGNPFWNGDPHANRSKVWAYGLRQPFRLTLRDGTLPYLGDVGGNLREEVDVAPRAANLGWPCYEGRVRPTLFINSRVCRSLYARGPSAVRFPIYAYPTAARAGRGSVTGGTFYTGTSYPRVYRGAYFFGDWSRSWLRYLHVDERNRVRGEVREFARKTQGPVEIEVGPDGDLYYIAINVAELRRITHTDQAQPAARRSSSAGPHE
jgi:glucose/arabinose dehydrogenase